MQILGIQIYLRNFTIYPWSTIYMQAQNNNRVAAITDPEYTCRYAPPFAPAAAPTNLR